MFKEHISVQGDSLLNKVDLPEESKDHTKLKEILQSSQIIEQLVTMLDKYMFMVKTCFSQNPYFERARQTSFEFFLNKERNQGKISLSEMLAIYTDSILRRGGMKIEEAKHEEYLEKIVKLFTHLIDKDLFIEVYRSYLAKRLLNEKS